MRISTRASLLGLVLSALVAIPASAETMQLGIVGNAQVGSNFINFGVFPVGTPYTPAPGGGTFVVNLVTAGSPFANAGVTAGEGGTIESLPSTAPGAPFVQPFMTFNGISVAIDLTSVPAGTTVGPFNLADTPNGATASFNINGTFVNGGVSTPLTGTFSATFNGTTVAQLLMEEASGTNITTPFSATFSTTTPTVPEPGTLLLMGAGLLGAGIIARRRKARS